MSTGDICRILYDDFEKHAFEGLPMIDYTEGFLEKPSNHNYKKMVDAINHWKKNSPYKMHFDNKNANLKIIEHGGDIVFNLLKLKDNSFSNIGQKKPSGKNNKEFILGKSLLGWVPLTAAQLEPKGDYVFKFYSKTDDAHEFGYIKRQSITSEILRGYVLFTMKRQIYNSPHDIADK